MTANTCLQVIASVAAKETKLDNSYINITLKRIKDNENGNQLISWEELKKNKKYHPVHQTFIPFQTVSKIS